VKYLQLNIPWLTFYGYIEILTFIDKYLLGIKFQITKYHANPEIYYRGREEQNVGFGRDMAVLDLTYYLSQIILSVVMGQLVESTGLPHLYIIASSLCAFGGAALSTKVSFNPSDCKWDRNQFNKEDGKRVIFKLNSVSKSQVKKCWHLFGKVLVLNSQKVPFGLFIELFFVKKRVRKSKMKLNKNCRSTWQNATK